MITKFSSKFFVRHFRDVKGPISGAFLDPLWIQPSQVTYLSQELEEAQAQRSETLVTLASTGFGLILTPKSCLDGSFWFNEFWQGIDPLILCQFDSQMLEICG